MCVGRSSTNVYTGSNNINFSDTRTGWASVHVMSSPEWELDAIVLEDVDTVSLRVVMH